MAQQVRQHGYIIAPPQKHLGKEMPERMRMHLFDRNAGLNSHSADGLPYGFVRNRSDAPSQMAGLDKCTRITLQAGREEQQPLFVTLSDQYNLAPYNILPRHLQELRDAGPCRCKDTHIEVILPPIVTGKEIDQPIVFLLIHDIVQIQLPGSLDMLYLDRNSQVP